MAHKVHTFTWSGNDWNDIGRNHNRISHYEVQDSNKKVVAILPCYYCPNPRSVDSTITNDATVQGIRADAICKYLDAMETQIQENLKSLANIKVAA